MGLMEAKMSYSLLYKQRSELIYGYLRDHGVFIMEDQPPSPCEFLVPNKALQYCCSYISLSITQRVNRTVPLQL
jgi:hypothetical protein